MDLLLDTNVLIFAQINDRRLGASARNLIVDPANRCFFSSVSTWEVAIKNAIHPEDIPIDASAFLSYNRLSGASELKLESRHAILLEGLPKRHKDPFDRMLLCQAKSEGMLFLTCDSVLLEYGEPYVLDARE